MLNNSPTTGVSISSTKYRKIAAKTYILVSLLGAHRTDNGNTRHTNCVKEKRNRVNFKSGINHDKYCSILITIALVSYGFIHLLIVQHLEQGIKRSHSMLIVSNSINYQVDLLYANILSSAKLYA